MLVIIYSADLHEGLQKPPLKTWKKNVMRSYDPLVMAMHVDFQEMKCLVPLEMLDILTYLLITVLIKGKRKNCLLN